jgi:hypothetical protein
MEILEVAITLFLAIIIVGVFASIFDRGLRS